MISVPRCYTGTLYDEPNNVLLLCELWNTILNNKLDGEQKTKTIYNTPFSLTASLWASLNSSYLYKGLDDKLKHGSVIVA